MRGILWAVPQEPIRAEPLYPNQKFPLHITLQYGVQREDWLYLEGKEFDVVIWETCWSDRIQALRVNLPPGIPCCNRFPHLTLSFIDGAQPAESNRVLEELVGGGRAHQFLPWNPRQHVLCRVEFYEQEVRSPLEAMSK